MIEKEIKDLEKAIRFLDLCRSDTEASFPTGALKDAHEWVESAARKVVREMSAQCAITECYTDKTKR